VASGVVRPPFEPSPRRYGLQVPARMSYAWHKTTEALPGGTHDQRDHGAGAGDRGAGDSLGDCDLRLDLFRPTDAL